MSQEKRERFKELFPRYAVDFQPRPLDLKTIFGDEKPVILEIGFGMGQATAEIAASRPENNYLGIEVHTPGVAALVQRINQQNLSNIRIIHHDAVEVLKYMIRDEALAGVHIFFPDPWPKKRHFKRRLLQTEFLKLLGPKLSPGGYVYAVTDWQDYADWMLDHLRAFPGLQNPHNGFAEPLPWRPRTAFEQKGIDRNHIIRELYFVKTT